MEKEGKSHATRDGFEDAVAPATTKSKKRGATHQHRESYAKAPSIVNLIFDSEVNASPEYKPHTDRLLISRQVVKASCNAFTTQVKINYSTISPGVTDLSHASDRPNSGSDDF